MKILAIETSCDETAAAVVEDGTKVLSNIIASQITLHQKTGGVVPEVAAREHVLKINPVVQEALETAFPKQAKTSPANLIKNIDAIAVTQGPGLLSSLVIGTTAASTLATYFNKPLIPVNHISGHIYANWLDENPAEPIQFPVLVLTVSGGHNELILMKSHVDFKLLGETLDDAAGEAFDKVARLLNLGYPGGPAISKAAAGHLPPENDTEYRPDTEYPTPAAGDPRRFPFPKARLGPESFDFSFSGLKTAVLNEVTKEHNAHKKLSPQFTADCAASFQEAVCQVLTDKLLRAAQKYKVKEVHLAGGVSANTHLRGMVAEKIQNRYFNDHNGRPQKLQFNPKLRHPQKFSYCTDNAAMIAAAAFFHYQKNPKPYLTPSPLLADPGLNLYNR